MRAKRASISGGMLNFGAWSSTSVLRFFVVYSHAEVLTRLRSFNPAEADLLFGCSSTQRSHEPLTERPWDEQRACGDRNAIVAETESAFDETALWLGASARPGGRAAAAGGVALPRSSGRDLGAARARARWRRRAAARLGPGRRRPGRALSLAARLPGHRRRAGPVAFDGRGRDPPRRAHACAGRLAGRAAARGRAGERRQSFAAS